MSLHGMNGVPLQVLLKNGGSRSLSVYGACKASVKGDIRTGFALGCCTNVLLLAEYKRPCEMVVERLLNEKHPIVQEVTLFDFSLCVVCVDWFDFANNRSSPFGVR